MRNNLQRKACICHMSTVHETVFKILVLMPQLNTMHTMFLKMVTELLDHRVQP